MLGYLRQPLLDYTESKTSELKALQLSFPMVTHYPWTREGSQLLESSILVLVQSDFVTKCSFYAKYTCIYI